MCLQSGQDWAQFFVCFFAMGEFFFFFKFEVKQVLKAQMKY